MAWRWTRSSTTQRSKVAFYIHGSGLREIIHCRRSLDAAAKVGALKKQQDQKVRALMRSINQLQEQLHTLKAQDQEHRRSALIQGLRKQQREQELLVDVLKQALQEKVPEFQSNRALVNDFVTKKSVGGPLRFRPKTREELENELRDVDQKYKWSMEQLRRERKRGSSRAQANHDSGDDEEDEEDIEADTPRQAHVGDDVRTIGKNAFWGL